MRGLAAVACLAVGGSLGGGCGGSGPAPDPITFTVVGTPALDGFVNALGSVTLDGDLGAGDQEAPAQQDRGLRFFVSFDISSLAPTLHVVTATLRVTQKAVVDTPYVLGPLLVDHVEYGAVLEAGAYDRSPLASAVGTLSTDATLETKTVTVTDAVQSDLTGRRGRSQYRIRFPIETNGDDLSNQAVFHSSETTVLLALRPTLIITYRP